MLWNLAFALPSTAAVALAINVASNDINHPQSTAAPIYVADTVTDHTLIPITPLDLRVDDLPSDDAFLTPELREAIGELHQQLQGGEAKINRLLEEMNDLSSTTVEQAKRAAEEAINFGERIDALLSEGGRIDQAINNATGYFRGASKAIAENPALSDLQRDRLLGVLADHQKKLTIESNRLIEMRNTVLGLTKKARQSREYLAMAHLAMVGGGIVEQITELNDTLSTMADTLRQLSDQAAVPTS